MVDRGLSLDPTQKKPADASGAQADIARQAGISPGGWVRVGCLLSRGGTQTPWDTEAEVQTNIAVCKCSMALQRYGHENLGQRTRGSAAAAG